ncbi:unnamed protein product, partial [Amoebophrya sp. A25]
RESDEVEVRFSTTAFSEDEAATMLQTVAPLLDDNDNDMESSVLALIGAGNPDDSNFPTEILRDLLGPWDAVPSWRVVRAPPEREVVATQKTGSAPGKARYARPVSSKARKHKRDPDPAASNWVYHDHLSESEDIDSALTLPVGDVVAGLQKGSISTVCATSTRIPKPVGHQIAIGGESGR